MARRIVEVHFSDGTLTTSGGESLESFAGSFVFHPGDLCKVELTSKRKKKRPCHGRACQLTGKYRKNTLKTQVRFLDDNSYGYVDDLELTPLQDDGSPGIDGEAAD